MEEIKNSEKLFNDFCGKLAEMGIKTENSFDEKMVLERKVVLLQKEVRLLEDALDRIRAIINEVEGGEE